MSEAVGAAGYGQRMSTSAVVVIAGRERSIAECADELRQYPGRTITRYDLPGPGDPTSLTRDEVARTHAVWPILIRDGHCLANLPGS